MEGSEGKALTLPRLLLAALTVAVLAQGWADVRRINGLEAERAPVFRVVTKHEAWRAVHPPTRRR
jgi:hypothetical protein